MSMKDEILSAEDLPLEKLHVPQWGKDVWIRTLTGEQREQFEDALDKHRNSEGVLVTKGIFRAMVAVFTVCDEHGKLIFSEADAVSLSRKAVKPLMLIQAKSNQMNALSNADIEALAKNSASTPESGSGSNSPGSGGAPSEKPSDDALPASLPNG